MSKKKCFTKSEVESISKEVVLNSVWFPILFIFGIAVFCFVAYFFFAGLTCGGGDGNSNFGVVVGDVTGMRDSERECLFVDKKRYCGLCKWDTSKVVVGDTVRILSDGGGFFECDGKSVEVLEYAENK